MAVMKQLSASVLFLACGCGGAVAYSEPVSIKVGTIKESDIRNSAFEFDKEISSETGDPYKAFMATARDELGGADPSAIEVTSIVLTVASDSKGIGTSGFADVMSGVEIFFTKGETTVVVGKLGMIPASTTMEIPVIAGEEELRVLHSTMLKGDFKVGVRGDAVMSPPAGFELRINVQLEFEALE